MLVRVEGWHQGGQGWKEMKAVGEYYRGQSLVFVGNKAIARIRTTFCAGVVLRILFVQFDTIHDQMVTGASS